MRELDMNALVVFESMWGNTRAVAEAVAQGLGTDTAVVHVDEAPATLPDDVDLLVVGGPTHAFSMSRASTRHDAVEKGATEGDETRGIREWLDDLPASDRIEVATFDTRVTKVKHLPGSAAKSAGKEVRRHHLGRLVATESFYVDDMEGPLHEGELSRAETWGAQLQAHR
jgi:flavodoxin-like protein